MYSLIKYNEVDFDFIYKSTLGRISFLKSKRNISKPKLQLVILFRNIIEPDYTKVYLHILMLWIMIGKFAKVEKIGHSLRRGVRYYRFVIKLNLFENFRYLKFLEFLSYCLFDYVNMRNYYFTVNNNNDVFFLIKNINGFSNLRFSDNFYLSGMPNDLFVKFLKKQYVDYFNSSAFFLSLFKLI